jgi:hypothetical protein
MFVEVKARIITEIILQQENTLYSLSGKRVALMYPLCIHQGKQSWRYDRNAEEAFCCFQELRMAVCVAVFLKAFIPLVTNSCTFETFIVLNTSHRSSWLENW